jgi:transposase, IS5 family
VEKVSKPLRTETRMYRKEDASQLKFEDFYLPFGGKLRSNNRWVIMAQQIPWQDIEKTYGQQFCDDNGSPAPAASCPPPPTLAFARKRGGDAGAGEARAGARIAMGALIIKERLATTDRETVEQIRENPYLQYFLGLSEYTDEELFHHSMMTHFRKRFNKDTLAHINQLIVDKAIESGNEKPDTSDDKNNNPPSNHGKLLEQVMPDSSGRQKWTPANLWATR